MHNRSIKVGEKWREIAVSKNGLVGNHTHTLDSKNRVFFPAKFREELGSPIVITINTDKCLTAYSVAEWDNFIATLSSHSKSKTKDLKRIYCGAAQKVVPDGQGRVMIDKSLLAFAKMSDSITFVGCGDCVEMWPEDRNPLTSLSDDLLAQLSDTMLELDI